MGRQLPRRNTPTLQGAEGLANVGGGRLATTSAAYRRRRLRGIITSGKPGPVRSVSRVPVVQALQEFVSCELDFLAAPFGRLAAREQGQGDGRQRVGDPRVGVAAARAISSPRRRRVVQPADGGRQARGPGCRFPSPGGEAQAPAGSADELSPVTVRQTPGDERPRPGLAQPVAYLRERFDRRRHVRGLCRILGRRRLRRAAPASLAEGSYEHAWVIVPAGAAASIGS
jgi:hypothetical protein